MSIPGDHRVLGVSKVILDVLEITVTHATVDDLDLHVVNAYRPVVSRGNYSNTNLDFHFYI